jgi:rare lipoprotein A
MVNALSFFTLLLIGVTVSAQKYSSDDTVTEYSLNGTMYHNKFEGRKTANGEIFNHNLFTAAHRKFKFGTLLLVTNQRTGLTDTTSSTTIVQHAPEIS